MRVFKLNSNKLTVRWLCLLLLLFSQRIALCHGIYVHSSITGRAVFSSKNLETFVRDNFGTLDFNAVKFAYDSQTRPIHGWIGYGSMQEDLMEAFQKRTVNHFYSPLRSPKSLTDNSDGPGTLLDPKDSFTW